MTAVAPGPASGTTAGEPWGYRPHLDGLRAVAVYLVVVFHAGVDRLSGGFIGVDVFFVLSGYLVTQLLLRDVRGDGRIGFRRFYARRFRRLLPAAVVVLIVTAVVYPWHQLAGRAGRCRGRLPGGVPVRVELVLHQPGDRLLRRRPSRRTRCCTSGRWSVEEQFYVVWPLLLGGIHALARRLEQRMWMAIRIVVGRGRCWRPWPQALRLEGIDLNRAYYGTDARAYQLLAGALLALTPSVLVAARRRVGLQPVFRVAAIGSLLSLFVLATSWADVSAITRGIVTTVLTIALVASLEITTSGVVRAALSLPPVVYLGRISYGVYLWHWLVILVLLDRFTLAPPVVAVAASVIASALAAVSYHLLEMPVRESRWLDQRRLSVVGAGLAASVLIGVVVAPAVLNRGDDAAPVVVAGGTAVDGGEEIPADLDWRGALEDRGDFPMLHARGDRAVHQVEGPPGAPHILLMGDSHARMYIPALTTLAEERGFTLSVAVAPGCPWQRGILRAGEGPIGTEVQDLGAPVSCSSRRVVRHHHPEARSGSRHRRQSTMGRSTEHSADPGRGARARSHRIEEVPRRRARPHPLDRRGLPRRWPAGDPPRAGPCRGGG